MSELTPCNLCTLRAMEAHALSIGQVVTLVPHRIGSGKRAIEGTTVLVHRLVEVPDEKKHWAAWLWEIPASCAC